MRKLRLGGSVPTGDYMAEKPVADIIKDALGQALGNHARTEPEGCPVLGGKLTFLDFSVVMGFQKCLLKGSMEMEFSLSDGKGEQSVWEGVIQGNGGAGTGDLVETVFNGALNDILNKLLSDKAFLNTVKKFSLKHPFQTSRRV